MTSTPSRNTEINPVLMYVVGIWMHRRSNAQRWNEMIQSMYNNAMSNLPIV
jgi:high-affinity Fe2+/Pb2+ permease